MAQMRQFNEEFFTQRMSQHFISSVISPRIEEITVVGHGVHMSTLNAYFLPPLILESFEIVAALPAVALVATSVVA